MEIGKLHELLKLNLSLTEYLELFRTMLDEIEQMVGEIDG